MLCGRKMGRKVDRATFQWTGGQVGRYFEDRLGRYFEDRWADILRTGGVSR
jgi:hypothetical protein